MTDTVPQILLDAWHDRPIRSNGEYDYVLNPLTDQAPACPPELLSAAGTWLQGQAEYTDVDVLLGEEDRGGILTSHLATMTGTPFVLAKWYPSSMAGEQVVPFRNGYTDGSLFINGVKEGDQVTIIDDVISTGATMIGLIEAVQELGATVEDVVVLCEKPRFGGAEQVEEATGVAVTAGFQVVVEDGRSRVVGHPGDTV